MPCSRLRVWGVLVGVLLSACSGSSSPDTPDSGTDDSGLQDAGETPDGGALEDGGTPPEDAGVPWTIRQSPRKCLEQVEGMVFAQGLFVGVGAGGEVCHSTDGRTWTRKARLSSRLRAITFGQGIFVAVGNGGVNGSGGAQLFSSPDGVTWTWRVPPKLFGNELVDVAFNGSTFVAAGGHDGTRQGTLLSSPDGMNWTIRVDQQGRYFPFVIAAGGQFIAANWTSPDGITWTQHGDVTASPSKVTFGDGRFVGVESKRVGTSSDGLHWTFQPDGTEGLADVAFDGARFIVVGVRGTLRTSPDGETWTPASVPSLEDLRSIVVAGDLRIAAGASHFLSTDGVSWSEAEAAPLSLNGVAKGDSLFVAVGTSGTIQTSPDGETWTKQTSGTLEELSQVRFLDGRFVALSIAGGVVISTDGVQWQYRGTGTSRRFLDVAWNGTLFAVSMGEGAATSPDLMTWTPISYQTLYGPTGLAAGASRWVGINCCGAARQPGGYFYTADTFGDWQWLSGISTPTLLQDVLFAHGKFVAVARQSIYTSIDGVAWTFYPTADVQWQSLSSDDSGFFVLGKDMASSRAVVATSTDGTSWSFETTPPTATLTRAVSDGTRVVAVGTGGVIVTRP